MLMPASNLYRYLVQYHNSYEYHNFIVLLELYTVHNYIDTCSCIDFILRVLCRVSGPLPVSLNSYDSPLRKQDFWASHSF